MRDRPEAAAAKSNRAHDRRGRAMLARLREIEQTLRHAEGTRSTPTDSWLNAYQENVRWLVTRLRERI